MKSLNSIYIEFLTKKKKNTDKCVLVGVNFRDFVKCSKFFFQNIEFYLKTLL